MSHITHTMKQIQICKSHFSFPDEFLAVRKTWPSASIHAHFSFLTKGNTKDKGC